MQCALCSVQCPVCNNWCAICSVVGCVQCPSELTQALKQREDERERAVFLSNDDSVIYRTVQCSMIQ